MLILSFRMRLKKKKQPEEAFQMAPMIDMVFLLLVFFMCVSTLANADRLIPLELAESDEAEIPEELSDRGTISIDAAGGIFIGGVEMDLEEATRRIGEAFRENPQLRLLVRADQRTQFSDIRRVLRACAEVGAYDVIFAAYQGR
jgi:biopolymer transport protein ExbD